MVLSFLSSSGVDCPFPAVVRRHRRDGARPRPLTQETEAWRGVSADRFAVTERGIRFVYGNR
jgi:hypothetical protein